MYLHSRTFDHDGAMFASCSLASAALPISINLSTLERPLRQNLCTNPRNLKDIHHMHSIRIRLQQRWHVQPGTRVTGALRSGRQVDITNLEF
jgi:hypothetical protein